MSETLTELELEDPVWLEFVQSHGGALPFHHPSWAALLAECYGFRPFALVLRGPDERPAAGLPVLETRTLLRRPRWISLPFTDVCAPLIRHVPPQRFAATLERTRLEAGARELEVRAAIADDVPSRAVAFRHVLELSRTPEEAESRLSSATRRNIRTAQRASLALRAADCEADIDTVFYRLQTQTRKRQGLPVQPRRFFRLLWRRILEPGLGFALFAYDGRTPAAGAIFLAWKRTVIYKYGASDAAYWLLRPNNLLFWEAIRRACTEGYEVLDFGRCDFDGAGLRRFKLGWGCDEEELRYTSLGGSVSPSRGAAQAVTQPILRRSPSWLVRALGSLLYRYAA